MVMERTARFKTRSIELNAATAPGTYAFINADALTGKTNAPARMPSKLACSTSLLWSHR